MLHPERRLQWLSGARLALLASAMLLAANARAPAQDQDWQRLWDKAGAVARESSKRIPRFIDAQIRFCDRRGRQTRSENGTIELSLLSDGSLQSNYVSKNKPQGVGPAKGQSEGGSAPGAGGGTEASRGGAPRGGPPKGGPPGAGMNGGKARAGGPPGGMARGGQAGNEKEREKIAALTDGNRLLEMIRLVDPFSASALKEVEFTAEPQEVVVGGRKSVRLKYLLRREENEIKGEMTIDQGSGSPLRCTALLGSKKAVALQYYFDEEEGQTYPAEIAFIETIRKGLFGREKIITLYKPREYLSLR